MWLDRLSSHSTPSGSPPPPLNRSYSPRRQSSLAPPTSAQRPFNPRSSSLLSLQSNDSSNSLLSSKRPNGNSQKLANTIPNTPDPLEVLQAVIGSETKQLSKITKSGVNTGHVVIEQGDFELDFGALNLHDLLLQCSSEDEEVPVLKSQTIEECTYSQSKVYYIAYLDHRWL